MIDAMKQLSLDFLWNRQKGIGKPPEDLEGWFKQLRKEKPERIFPYLVEASEKIEKYYTLSPDPLNPDTAILEVSDFQEGDNIKLPFNKPSGPQSPALGPVIKRTYTPGKGIGPKKAIQDRTIASFKNLAQEDTLWHPFFASAHDTFTRSKLFIFSEGKTFSSEADENAYVLAVKQIPERTTVFLAFKDREGKLPGEHPEYLQYLQSILARAKYTTKAAPSIENSVCALCSAEAVTTYSNALKGAGINIANLDRKGAFPGISVKNASLGYPLCLDCADLLYIYKNYVAKLFIASIAGSRALIIPKTQVSGKARALFFGQISKLAQATRRIEVQEERLMRLLGDERTVTSLDIIWADIGQNIEKLQGSITDILPSRLRELTQVNDKFNRDVTSPLFPEHRIPEFNLTLSFLLDILKRPGGKKAKSANASRRMFQLREDLASAIYHGQSLHPERFWNEVFYTARWYLTDAVTKGNSWGLINEGYSDKDRKPYWTFAGWLRHLAQFMHYLRELGVFPMLQSVHHPESENLKPFFGPESGIDTDQKAFAFLLGILYGKVMQVQAAKGVNVGSNTLTWLKRLTLAGNDLPELYCKVREKLLAYETEGNVAVREVLEEVGNLGARIGDGFNLSQTTTCYFLLLGQSVSARVLPSRSKEQENNLS